MSDLFLDDVFNSLHAVSLCFFIVAFAFRMATFDAYSSNLGRVREALYMPCGHARNVMTAFISRFSFCDVVELGGG